MERVPRTGLSMYHQTIAPAPPPDLPPLLTPISTEPVSTAGPAPVVPPVVRHHVVPTHTAQITSHVDTSPGCSDVGGDHLERYVYLHKA